jgi:segregation and condensation protein A
MGEMVQIQVDGFSGPVDLLLDLIDRAQLDITALSLAEITDQYWREIESNHLGDPDALADFLAVGSKLLYIKSAALVASPGPQEKDIGEQLDEAAGELTHLLEEHKRFREAIELFRQLEEEGRRAFARAAPPKKAPLPPGLEGVTLDTLLDAVKEALSQQPAAPEEAVLHIEPVTVTEKIAEIGAALAGRRGKLPFRPLLRACQTRTEIVVLFLAVLEMIKAGQVWAEQDEPFGEITLVDGAAEPAA